jgi:hypothetical protein
MKQSTLSVRVNRKNQNHHLWNNNGKWWCHLTLHHPDYTSERRRLSLNTRDLDVARQRRDRLFANLENTVARKAVAA